MLDLAAEFYLETVAGCSRSARCAQGRARLPRRARSSPRAIRRTALLTVEGERDDICALGQTAAAHDLCTGHASRTCAATTCRPGVGHYGVFSGKRWEEQVYPIVRNMILSSE